MRKFDHDGLILAEYQGKLFEKSNELECSTGIFIRRFLHSILLDKLDMNTPSLLSMDVCEGMYSIVEQFGTTEYGSEKYSPATLFWMGYMYRYIAYTREQTTGFIMKLFSYKLMNELYYVYHTQDPEWCIRNLLEVNDLNEDIFDNNLRLKAVIHAKGTPSTRISS